MNSQNSKVGLDALLTPDNSVLVMIDHQAFQFANTRNMDPTMILNNTIGLAKAAKAFKVPTILIFRIGGRGGGSRISFDSITARLARSRGACP
jgi:nicotinamidase-related amidase